MEEAIEIMTGVTEHSNGLDIQIGKKECGRYVVSAISSCGSTGYQVDAEEMLHWIAENKPELYIKYVTAHMLMNHT